MPETFQQPADHPPLAPGAIHVWRARIEPAPADLATLRASLSVDEHARAARFHFERDRLRYSVARGVLRRLLGRYADVAPDSIGFAYGSREKPAVAQPAAASDIQFNVSHRGDFALYAFAQGREVGIDIELLRDVPEALFIVRHHFTPDETQLLEDAAEHGAGRECFFRLWTRKEAVIKAVGTGLSMPLDEFDVSSSAAARGAAWHTVHVPSRPEVAWLLRDLPLGDDYRGALCVEGEPGEVMLWNAE